jgi:hypothetical protein
MRDAPYDRHLPEVLVQRYQYAALRIGAPKDLFVARVFDPIASPDHIVPGGLDLDPSASPHASV